MLNTQELKDNAKSKLAFVILCKSYANDLNWVVQGMKINRAVLHLGDKVEDLQEHMEDTDDPGEALVAWLFLMAAGADQENLKLLLMSDKFDDTIRTLLLQRFYL